MTKIVYCSPTIDNEGKIKFSRLQTDADLRVMWSIFHRYATKCPIKVDATLVRSTNNIIKMMKRREPCVGNEMSC